MPHLAFIFCCLVWGSSFILVERVTHAFGPVEIGIWRLVGGAAVVGGFWWYKRGEIRITRRDWTLCLTASLLFTAPPVIIQGYVLSQGYGHSFFGTMVGAIPLLTILVSVPMLGTLPSRRELFGVLGGLACMLLLVNVGMERGMSPGLLALTFLIPLSSALSNTFIKWKLPHVPAAPLTAMLLLPAAGALAVIQASPHAVESLDLAAPANAVVTTSAVVYLVLLGVVASGVSTLLFVWLILQKGPLFAGMATYVVPVVALLWGTLDHERITPQQIVAIVGVLGMVALVQSGSRRAAIAREPEPGTLPATISEAMAPAAPVAATAQVALAGPVADFNATPLLTTPESQVA